MDDTNQWTELHELATKNGQYEWINDMEETTFPTQGDTRGTCWLHSMIFMLTSAPFLDVGVWAYLNRITNCDNSLLWESEDKISCVDTIFKIIQTQYREEHHPSKPEGDTCGGYADRALMSLLNNLSHLGTMSDVYNVREGFDMGLFQYPREMDKMFDVLLIRLEGDELDLNNIGFLVNDSSMTARHGYRYAGSLYSLDIGDSGHAMASKNMGTHFTLRDSNIEWTYQSKSPGGIKAYLNKLLETYNEQIGEAKTRKIVMVYVRINNFNTLKLHLEEAYDSIKHPSGKIESAQKPNLTLSRTQASRGSFDGSRTQLFRGGQNRYTKIALAAVGLLTTVVASVVNHTR